MHFMLILLISSWQGIKAQFQQGATSQPVQKITGENLKQINWTQIDRRAEENWWHLYPFGERYYDIDITWKPWRDTQLDLYFSMPFYGFRFNYTFVFPDGFIAFSHPYNIQPPYSTPSPKWPDEPDASLIAAFMTEQSFVYVGDTRVSHVWYRVISRPPPLDQPLGDQSNHAQASAGPTLSPDLGDSNIPIRKYKGQILRTEIGRVEDPEFLDLVTHDLQHGMVGTRGFKCDYALLVTWERMGYGAGKKTIDVKMYETEKRWQNTYQMIVMTDEVRTYVMLNYANINTTSSTPAGPLFPRGGNRQPALVGFNGGNGTGWFDLLSANGDSYNLMNGSTQVPGRWLARIDEEIEYGGCSNASTGVLQMDKPQATMLGGFILNVTAACFQTTDVLKLQIDEKTMDCERLDMVIARCVVPVNTIFKTGLVIVRLSVDGGKKYQWWNKLYIITPLLAHHQVNLINDPIIAANNWRRLTPDNLTMTWPAFNISMNPNASVDITLWGYWEDVLNYTFEEIGSIVRKTPNRGAYSFNPRTLRKNDMMHDAFKKYVGGLIQVRVSQNWMSDKGDGIYWSDLIPFGWYFYDTWKNHSGSNWALDMCLNWFEHDGKRDNISMVLEDTHSCPCTMGQALADVGRFVAHTDCDINGNHQCYYTQGAQHCVVSTTSVWTGAGQVCCYDFEGQLMSPHDHVDHNDQYLKYYSYGVPYRAHPWGTHPFKRPPYVPSMSNFYNDLMPYEYCCKWAEHCEFYYWRRTVSKCLGYRPPALGFVYGRGHFISFDGARFTFNGKGYYTLSMFKNDENQMNVQVRMEQPTDNVWKAEIPVTVVTGVAAQDSDSSVVQIFARKDFTRWRYRTDVYVDGLRVFFDTPWQKLQTFKGVTIRSPTTNLNMSPLEVMFNSGMGLLVTESRGALNVQMSVPPFYNETYPYYTTNQSGHRAALPPPLKVGVGNCASFVWTQGLFGPWNNDVNDDFTTPDCNAIKAGNYPPSENESRNIYYEFGEKWRVDGVRYPLLFQTKYRPIYNPFLFASPNYIPIFDPWRNNTDNTFWGESSAFSHDEVKVACQGTYSCQFDYITSGRRENALDTLNVERKFVLLKYSTNVTNVKINSTRTY